MGVLFLNASDKFGRATKKGPFHAERARNTFVGNILYIKEIEEQPRTSAKGSADDQREQKAEQASVSSHIANLMMAS